MTSCGRYVVPPTLIRFRLNTVTDKQRAAGSKCYLIEAKLFLFAMTCGARRGSVGLKLSRLFNLRPIISADLFVIGDGISACKLRSMVTHGR